MRYSYSPMRPPAPQRPCPPKPVCPPSPCCPDPCVPEPICCNPCERPVCPPRPCPPKPCPCRSYLLPRVIASGREWRRRCQLCLTVSGLPECAKPPFSLIAVSALDPADTTFQPAPVHTRMTMHVVIPLLCQVRDRNGCIFTGQGLLETDVCMHLSVPCDECWRSAILVQPCVRLVSMPCASDVPQFDTCLEVLIEAYLIRWEPSSPMGQPAPACRELPLYPQMPFDACR